MNAGPGFNSGGGIADFVRGVVMRVVVLFALVALVVVVLVILVPAAIIGAFVLLVRALWLGAKSAVRNRGGIPASDGEGRENVRVRMPDDNA